MTGRTRRRDERTRRRDERTDWRVEWPEPSEPSEPSERPRAPRDPSWTRAVRRPWTVACAVAAVVLGPAATTASALDRANAAPHLHAPQRGTHDGAVSP
ncbi:hypothetical protein [Streptomyces collinus]|uniref:hypothetical protein n=1 Tax=Streptomyces collinus TaxID=42684 RepID=UPI0036ED6351